MWRNRDREQPAEEPPAEDVVVIDAETAVKDPALTEAARDPAATEAAHDPAAGGVPPAAGEGPPAAAAPAALAGPPGSITPQRWSEILVTFVDDPRGSVKMAADAVDSAIEEIVTSVRARQQALASCSRPWRRHGRTAARTPSNFAPRCATTASSAPRYRG
jgi:hypothetical protein